MDCSVLFAFMQMLRSILRQSLKLASQDNMTSIAWPTIGCGNLGYPTSFVAAAMLNEIRTFSSANQSSCPYDIRIVIHDGDQTSIDEFLKQFQAVLPSTAAKLTIQTRGTSVVRVQNAVVTSPRMNAQPQAQAAAYRTKLAGDIANGNISYSLCKTLFVNCTK